MSTEELPVKAEIPNSIVLDYSKEEDAEIPPPNFLHGKEEQATNDFQIHPTESWENGCLLTQSPKPSTTELLHNFLETFDVEQERRVREMQEFLVELASFKEQLRKEKTRDKAVEILPRHLDKFAREMRALEEASRVDEFPCTRYTQKLRTLHAGLKKAMAKKEALRTIMKQEEGIRVIREKMKEAEEAHLNQQGKKGKLGELKSERTLEGEVGVDFKDLSTRARAQLAERVISVKKIRHLQRLGRQERCRAIVKKILLEEKRAKEIEAAKNKRYDYKVKRKAKFLVEMTGSSEILHRRCLSDESNVTEEEEVEEGTVLEEIAVEKVEKKKKKEGKEKKKKKKKDKKSKKSSSKSSKKKRKKEKKKGKGKKKAKKGKGKQKKKSKKKSAKDKLEDLVFPQAPITNPRHRIAADDAAAQMLCSLVKDYENLVQILEDHDDYNKAYADRGLDYERDGSFHWLPDPVVFKDFQKGKIYKKKITIINGGDAPKKCKLHKIEMEDGFDPSYFDSDTIGVQYIIPGLSFKITVTFSPQNLDRPSEGKLTMITYRPHGPRYGQFTIPIKCVPLNDSILLHPKILAFDTVPFWRAKKRSKTVKVANPGRKVHRVTIKRLHDEVELQQYWRNSNYEMGGSSLEQSGLHDKFSASNVEGELLVNLFNAFGFSKYFLELPPNTEEILRVTFKEADHVGCYLEWYTCDFYEKSGEDDFQYAGSEELLVTAETTGHVLRLCPDVLDFDLCVFDSVYQRNFHVHDSDGVPHQIRVKIPACLRDYVNASPDDACVQASGHQDIAVRLVPRKEMMVDQEIVRYFDDRTGVLEFPVRVGVSSKNLDGVPCVATTVYAVIGESGGVVLAPLDLELASREQGNVVVDLGECSTVETVWTSIALTNRSYTQQHFGFLDLPQCIFLEPNFGFGVLEPMETQVINVMLSPEVGDLAGPQENPLTFRISATTIKEQGGLKKAFNYHKLSKSLEMVEAVLKTNGESLLENVMTLCGKLIADGYNNFEQEEAAPKSDEVNLENVQDANTINSGLTTTSEPPVLRIPNNSRETCESWSEQGMGDAAQTNAILIRCTIVDPLCSLSHQEVVFPSTPCGSYSMASVVLSTKIFPNGREKRKLEGAYRAKFKIAGDSEQFRVEPTCGELRNDEVVKITLIAKPELPQELVDAKAAAIQREKLIAKKREELMLKREKEREKKSSKKGEKKKKKKGKSSKSSKGDKSSKGTGKKKKKKKEKGKKEEDKSSKGKKRGKRGKDESSKGKKGKKGKSKSSKGEKGTLEEEQSEPEPIPPIIIDDKDIVVTYWDLYPAEMCLWREFEPYCIFGQFTCEVSFYERRKPEKLYLDVMCHVIPPDFAHNFDLQRLNFGPTPLGMARKKILEVQNIKYQPIRPKITRPCPIGPFTCPDTSRVKLPPEYRLQLPISFRPLKLKEIFEYIEIVSGKTICPLILSGEGVETHLTITPEFLVCRLEASPNGFTDLALEVKNKCAGSILIKFDKVCEVEGAMKAVEKEKEAKKGKTGKGSGKKSKKGSEKKSKKGSEKKSKKGSGEKSKKGSKKKKGKSNKGSKSGKGKKPSKFSAQLTEDEVYSLGNFFENREGPPLFEMVGGSSVEIPAESKQVVKLRFGVSPPPPTGKKGKDKKKKKKKGKGGSEKSSKGKKSKGSKKYKSSKGSKKSKSSKGSKKSKSSKGSKKSKKSKKSDKDGGKYYVAKFNVMVGGSTFFKDFIVVGKFV